MEEQLGLSDAQVTMHTPTAGFASQINIFNAACSASHALQAAPTSSTGPSRNRSMVEFVGKK